MPDAELRQIRGNEIAMIYQEPMASLNPAMKVGQQLMEVPMIHEGAGAQAARAQALAIVEAVRLPDPPRMIDSYPHQLSGGQQQRIVIAMALLSKPALLILDEPTTALDVTVEAGIVDLVKDLGREFGTSMLFITHNLGLVLETCDRITVMYSGEAVETGPIDDVFDEMRHPYTQGLFRSIPLPGADKNTRPLVPIPGNLPLPHERPPGCNFGPRCDYFEKGRCDAAEIPMLPVTAEPRHALRPLRRDRLGCAEPAARKTTVAVGPGRRGAARRGPEEILQRRLQRAVRRRHARGQGQRDAQLRGARGRDGGHRRRERLRQVDARQGADGAGDRDRGHGHPRQPRHRHRCRSRSARHSTVSSIQMVFQNPFDTLNPSHSIGSQIIRMLEKFRIGKTNAEREARMLELLDLVKLPRAFAQRMPRQLSGGQKQRIGIARAFAGTPKVVVADEPVSALDVSVQAAVTDLLMDIQRENRTTMLFISHDLVDRALPRRPGDGDVSRPRRRDGHDRRRSSSRPTTPTPRRCCRRCRSPTPRWSRSASCWRATFPRR